MVNVPFLVRGKEKSGMDIKMLEKGKLALKDKEKSKARYNKYMYIIIYFFIVGYAFFLSTTYWYEDAKDVVAATKINTIKSWEKREVQLIDWKYSKKQNIMEIQIAVDNKSYDGIDTYNITALEKSKGYLDVEKIVEEDGFYVIRITDLPKKWSEISLRIDTPDGADSLCKFYTNKFDVETVDTIKDLTYNEYMIARLDSLISAYNDEIEKLQKDIEEQKELITNCNNDIEKYREEEKFQTDKEIEETERIISDAQNTISSANTQIESDNADIAEYQERISLTEKQKELYK